MSKNIVIVNNGVQETWEGISKLRTNSLSAGTIDWLAEDETVVIPLEIQVNGTYTAQSAGVYGYNPVTVTAQGTLTGMIDGVETQVTVDEDGYLVYTPVE